MRATRELPEVIIGASVRGSPRARAGLPRVGAPPRPVVPTPGGRRTDVRSGPRPSARLLADVHRRVARPVEGGDSRRGLPALRGARPAARAGGAVEHADQCACQCHSRHVTSLSARSALAAGRLGLRATAGGARGDRAERRHHAAVPARRRPGHDRLEALGPPVRRSAATPSSSSARTSPTRHRGRSCRRPRTVDVALPRRPAVALEAGARCGSVWRRSRPPSVQELGWRVISTRRRARHGCRPAAPTASTPSRSGWSASGSTGRTRESTRRSTIWP